MDLLPRTAFLPHLKPYRLFLWCSLGARCLASHQSLTNLKIYKDIVEDRRFWLTPLQRKTLNSSSYVTSTPILAPLKKLQLSISTISPRSTSEVGHVPLLALPHPEHLDAQWPAGVFRSPLPLQSRSICQMN
jgi:hypothetical protein